MIDLFALLKLAGIISALIALAKIMGKIGSASGKLLTWLLYGILGILIIWGIYNQVAQWTGWFEPISLDNWIRKILSHIPFIGKYFQ